MQPYIEKLDKIRTEHDNMLLALLMDESHRYRASAGIRAINELKPILGLEVTGTPFVEATRGAVPSKNVIYDYPLSMAMADGFVKEPAVVTRKDFNPAGMSPEEIERMKLEDGVRLHESVKVELETYARESDNPIVKPFLLVIARDTTHAGQLLQLIQSDGFFDGLNSSECGWSGTAKCTSGIQRTGRNYKLCDQCHDGNQRPGGFG